MATVSELTFEEHLAHLREIAENRRWNLQTTGEYVFELELGAHDGTHFRLRVECEGFPLNPPAWHWISSSGEVDEPSSTPKGGGYFHGSGRICAPWNRLAYKNVDPKGPHADWELANWADNPKTGACTTLSAMALRIAVELMGEGFKGRLG